MLGKRAKRGVSGRDGSPSRPSVPAVGTQGRKTARIHRSDLSRPPFCHFRPKNTLFRVLQEGVPSFHGIILGQRFPDAGMTASSSRLDDPLMPASRRPDAGMIFRPVHILSFGHLFPCFSVDSAVSGCRKRSARRFSRAGRFRRGEARQIPAGRGGGQDFARPKAFSGNIDTPRLEGYTEFLS